MFKFTKMYKSDVLSVSGKFLNFDAIDAALALVGLLVGWFVQCSVLYILCS